MYKHGAFADLLATKDFIPPDGVGTLPVYFGTLPVNQLMDYTDKVNKPILLQSYNDAVNKVGYNENNWKDFTLCEAIYAHFKNDIQPIGPIVVVNVLDPATHIEAMDTTEAITLTNGIGYIESDLVVLNTIDITGEVLDTDYSAVYNSEGTKVILTDLKGDLGNSIDVTYRKIDTSLVTEQVVIGGNTDSVRTGIHVLELVYQNYNMIPTLLCAPGWSQIKAVNDALKAMSQEINGHWYAFVNSDIDASSATTITDSISLKATNGQDSSYESPCWPMALNGTKKFHISTLATVTMQWVDYNNGNVPYETPSNKPIDVTGMCLADGTPILFDQIEANELNAKGIRTLTYWGGRWVLWGGHTGEYEYGKDMDVRNIFDSSVRMMQYIANTFQSRYGILVDSPMNRSQVDTILNDYQEWFDNLIAQGKLLYGEVGFEEISNPTSDVIEGDFVFDLATTTTPQAKSLTAKISYTSDGISVLFGGDQA